MTLGDVCVEDAMTRTMLPTIVTLTTVLLFALSGDIRLRTSYDGVWKTVGSKDLLLTVSTTAATTPTIIADGQRGKHREEIVALVFI